MFKSRLTTIDDFKNTLKTSMNGKLSKPKVIMLWGMILKYSDNMVKLSGEGAYGGISLPKTEKVLDNQFQKTLKDLIDVFAETTGYRPTYRNWKWELEIE